MSDFNEITRTIKKMADDAVRAGKPAAIEFGTVINESPLQIRADNNVIHDYSLGDLRLTHHVRDYEVDISVSHSTDKIYNIEDLKYIIPGPADTPIPSMVPIAEHNHKYTGRKKIIVHKALKVGEKVILLQEQGGQHWVVWDRVEDPPISGEWLG